ncbi:MAG: glycosyltransferase family 2 protein [Actinomycetota bacterium]|nr:glycosyltransferase family 2 protein [Actinomycetota bacterium]
MRITAAIVNFNQRAHTLECVESILASFRAVDGPTQVVVVDNGSADGSNDAVRARFPQVCLIEMGANVGFSSAAARAVRETAGDWVLMINNDATIAPDAVELMLSAGEAHPSIGSVAATIVFADGSSMINSAGFMVDRLGVAHERLLGEYSDILEPGVVEVFGASMGGALLRRTMLEDIGGIDDSFFMWLEDVDVAWRGRSRGWRAVHQPRAVIHHHHAATAGHTSDLKYYHVGLNRVRVLAKNMSTPQLLTYAPAIVAYDAAYIAYVALADRTTAPLRGRLRGIAEWRCYRRARPAANTSAALAPVAGLRAALGRRRAWMARSSGVNR